MIDLAARAGDSVLGCLLTFYTPELLTRVQACGVAWDDFPHDRQRVIYRAILALHKTGSAVDPLTVEGFLRSHGKLEDAGGPGYLAVCEASASPGSVRDHARLVCEHARQSRLVVAVEYLAVRVRAWDDPDGLLEAFAAVAREMREPNAPKLHVVKDAA